MAFYFWKTDSPEIEQLLRQYYQSLSETDKWSHGRSQASCGSAASSGFPSTLRPCVVGTLHSASQGL